MPSSSLANIAQQIDDLKTDDFAKFYMYATLLKYISMREAKTYNESLPIFTPTLGWAKSLDIGTPNAVFIQDIDAYKKEFDLPKPDVFSVANKLAKAYVRKGQFGDFVFIIKRMKAHLCLIERKSTTFNSSIFSGVSFEMKKKNISDSIEAFSNITDAVLSMVDNSVHALVAIMVAIAGFFLMLKMSFLLGAIAMAVGAYFAVSYVVNVIDLENKMPELQWECQKKIFELQKPSDDFSSAANSLHDKNFILSAILFPMLFSSVVVEEQLAMDSDMLKGANDRREDYNVLMSRM